MTRDPSFPSFTPTSGELIRRRAARFGDKPFAVLGDDRLSYAGAEADRAP